MKLYHLTLIFLLISLSVMIVLHFRIRDLYAVQQERTELEERLRSAVDHGVLCLTNDQEGKLRYHKEQALENFFLTLYAAFGALEDEQLQERLQLYIPVIAVIVPEGFYFSFYNYKQTQTDFGNQQLIREWSELYPYPVYGENSNAEPFINYLEEIISQHNQIAEQYGIQYHFYLPIMDNSDWQRAITGPAMIVLFQGYPLSSGDSYNRTSISGAQIYQKKEYIVRLENGQRNYHLAGCEKLEIIDTSEQSLQWMCRTIQECVSLGAFPCSECLPEFVGL